MDYPKSVPNVGLVNGKFVDENTTTGQVGSLIPAAWGSAVTDELLAVIRAAELEPTEGDNDQLLQALQAIVSAAIPSAPDQASDSVAGVVKLVSDALMAAGVDDAAAVTLKKLVGKLVSQGYTAFTTSGAAAAYTLAPVPALAGYAENQRFRVKFDRAGAGATTLNISGRGAKRLKQYDSAGNKVDAVLAAGQLADVEYDGVDMVVLDPLPAPVVSQVGIQGAVKNLFGSATGSSAITTYSADEIIVENPANQYQTLRAVSVAPSVALSGANGLDTGTSTASTWYSVWVIWDGSTTAGLLSLSATAPTMPAGYTHKARVGWIRTDSTANKYPLSFVQHGNKAFYVPAAGTNLLSPPSMAAGVLGSVNTPTWSPFSVDAFIPPTASIVKFFTAAFAQGIVYMVADSNAYGVYSSATNPPPIMHNTASPGADLVQFMSSLRVGPTRSLFCASNTAAFNIRCLGWEDNL